MSLPASHGSRVKHVGEDLPMAVQTRPRAGANAFLRGIVVIGIGSTSAPGNRDGDRGVAIGRDEDQSAQRLCTRRLVGGQGLLSRCVSSRWIRMAALSDIALPSGSTSVGICPIGLIVSKARTRRSFPTTRFPPRETVRRERQRRLDRRRTRALLAVERIHAYRSRDQDADPPCSIAFMRRCSSSSGTSSVCVAMVQVYPKGSLSVALRSP